MNIQLEKYHQKEELIITNQISHGQDLAYLDLSSVLEIISEIKKMIDYEIDTINLKSKTIPHSINFLIFSLTESLHQLYNKKDKSNKHEKTFDEEPLEIDLDNFIRGKIGFQQESQKQNIFFESLQKPKLSFQQQKEKDNSYLEQNNQFLKEQIYQFNQQTNLEPIYMNEQQENNLTNDDSFRKRKENQQNIQNIQQDQMQKFTIKKNQHNSQSTKNQTYTYDFNNQLINVQQVNANKLPQFSFQMQFNVQPQQNEKIKIKIQKNQNINLNSKQIIYNDLLNNFQLSDNPKFNSVYPEIWNSFNINSGVTLTTENLIKFQSTKPQVNSKMNRQQYLEQCQAQTLQSITKTIQTTRNLDTINEFSQMKKIESLKTILFTKDSNSLIGNGSIKINKNYEDVINQIIPKNVFKNEISKREFNQIKQIHEKKFQNDPIDNFNQQIIQKKTWGKDELSQKQIKQIPFIKGKKLYNLTQRNRIIKKIDLHNKDLQLI